MLDLSGNNPGPAIHIACKVEDEFFVLVFYPGNTIDAFSAVMDWLCDDSLPFRKKHAERFMREIDAIETIRRESNG